MVPFIDLTRQYKAIEEEILSATKRVFEKGRFILGEEVSTFEEEFARYCGVRYGVGVNSGTDALYLALRAAGIGEGDEVVTVANSFIASALAISFAGAKPIFFDIEPETYNLDPNALEHLLKKQRTKGKRQRIKAILPVHLYGHPAQMDAIMEVAHRYHLAVIEDACQAHGAEYRGRKAGSFGTLGCFSFYPTKNLGGSGDGGMVITDDKKLYEKLRLLRCYGEKKKYEHILQGENSRLDEIQAAILRVKLKYLDKWNDQRRKKAHRYKKELEGSGVVCPSEKEGSQPCLSSFCHSIKEKKWSSGVFKREEGSIPSFTIPSPSISRRPTKIWDIKEEISRSQNDFPSRCSLSRSFPSLPNQKWMRWQGRSAFLMIYQIGRRIEGRGGFIEDPPPLQRLEMDRAL